MSICSLTHTYKLTCINNYYNKQKGIEKKANISVWFIYFSDKWYYKFRVGDRCKIEIMCYNKIRIITNIEWERKGERNYEEICLYSMWLRLRG